jgi:hypothetical protein
LSDTVREELSGLRNGDLVSVVGALTTELFEWKGERRVSHKLTADRAMALKPKPPKPKAQRAAASTPEAGSGARSRRSIMCLAGKGRRTALRQCAIQAEHRRPL